MGLKIEFDLIGSSPHWLVYLFVYWCEFLLVVRKHHLVDVCILFCTSLVRAAFIAGMMSGHVVGLPAVAGIEQC